MAFTYYKDARGKVSRITLEDMINSGNVRAFDHACVVFRTEFDNGAVLSTVLLSVPPSTLLSSNPPVFISRPTYETIYFPSPDDAADIRDIAPVNPIRFRSKQHAQRAHRSIRNKLAFKHKNYGITTRESVAQ